MSLEKYQLTDEIPGFEAGKTYTVASTEEFSSQVRNFAGLRVVAKDSKGNEVVEALWLRTPVGPKSKLGCFMKLLGKDPLKWVDKKIRVVKWGQGNRVIEFA